MDKTAKAINLLQFARKAGKVVHGADACERAINRNKVYLVVLCEDLAPRSGAKIKRQVEESHCEIPVLVFGTQSAISAALGTPITGILGVTDKQFASSIQRYWAE